LKVFYGYEELFCWSFHSTLPKYQVEKSDRNFHEKNPISKIQIRQSIIQEQDKSKDIKPICKLKCYRKICNNQQPIMSGKNTMLSLSIKPTIFHLQNEINVVLFMLFPSIFQQNEFKN
jgi:hypothetical protein